MTTRPDLSDDEIDAICDGYKQHAAKVRYLQGLGLTVRRRPNGRPLVARAEWERRMGKSAAMAQGAQATGGPKWTRAA